MSDTPTNTPEGQDDSAGNDGNIKALREAAEAGKAATKELENAKRELAFAKAGIDTDTKLGSMLAKTYEGDLTDVEALKAEWNELNPAPPAQSETPAPDAPTPEGFQDPSGQQQHREQLNGQPSGEQPKEGPNPFDKAFEELHANRQLPVEDRQRNAMASVLGDYFKGDPRVMFDRQAHLAAAQQAAQDDQIPG